MYLAYSLCLKGRRHYDFMSGANANGLLSENSLFNVVCYVQLKRQRSKGHLESLAPGKQVY